MAKGNIRIRDIANMANVSVGTVDRVLHNRGNVSEDSLRRVNEILEKIDYKPNLIARTLGTNKTYRFAVLMPDFKKDPFWIRSNKGIDDAFNEFGPYGLELIRVYFDPDDVQSFNIKAKNLLSKKPDGVVLVPFFYHESLQFLKQCKDNSIQCVAFNTQLPEENTLSFIGQDLKQSGRLAAHLMGRNVSAEDHFVIFHIEEEFENAFHLRQKEAGFRAYFNEKKLNENQVTSFELGDGDRKKMTDDVLQIIRKTPDLRGIFVTTSKTHYIARILDDAKLSGYNLVGYDLLDENLEYLKKGVIDFLIHQNPRRQAYLGLAYMTDHFIFRKDVPEVELLPLDVITKENVNTYLNSIIH